MFPKDDEINNVFCSKRDRENKFVPTTTKEHNKCVSINQNATFILTYLMTFLLIKRNTPIKCPLIPENTICPLWKSRSLYSESAHSELLLCLLS